MSLAGCPDEHHHRPVAAELLPPPSRDAPVCACCTPDPARRAALERLRAQRDHLAASRAAHALMPLGGCCGSRRRAA